MNRLNFRNDYLFYGRVKNFFFYILAFFAILIVIPVTSICGISFMIAGLICIFALPIKILSYIVLPDFAPQLFNISTPMFADIPYYLVMPLTMLIGSFIFILGYFLWKLTLKVINLIGFYNVKK